MHDVDELGVPDGADRRWRTHLIDTTDRPVAESVDEVEEGVHEQREALRSGRLALARGWSRQAPTRADHGG